MNGHRSTAWVEHWFKKANLIFLISFRPNRMNISVVMNFHNLFLTGH